ncbi:MULTISPECIES: DUF1707 domain-containing protein [unclassified Corynebacterium]|uniref:DUF1707 SHOCT-like domain-containing protein n=1 Tax=unclassified Corynebacterium TaxID=2624378 RepID=UPI00143D5936|nr:MULTISPECIES: DUF1707 domain-containing protein [unclassified Corynebacterium]
MSNPNFSDYRISDAEREHAIDQLTTHCSEGRLSLDAYEQRVDQVIQAVLYSDLLAVFSDLPAPSSPPMDIQAATPERTYTESEINELRVSGRRIRAGLSCLSALGATFYSLYLNDPLPLAFLPAVIILLYIMRIGPDSWYTPSLQQLERQRTRAIAAQQRNQLALMRMQHQQQQAQQRALLQQRRNELKHQVLDWADDAITRFKR